MDTPRSFKKFKKGPLALSLALLGFSAALSLFLYGKIQANKQVQDEAQGSWQRAVELRREINFAEDRVKKTAEDRVKLSSHFAESLDAVPFLDSLEELAGKVSAKSEISLVDIAKDKSGIFVNLRVAGSFESVYKYLLLLENSSYVLEFRAVNLHKASSESTEWQGDFALKLLTFIP
ncbi:MAG: hypothetical protein AAB500_01060 [Patescibacteria group bacterium]